MAEKYIKVTQVKSELGHVARNRGTIRALGLNRIGDSNLLPTIQPCAAWCAK